jgi:hypothetical protein
VQLYHIQDCGDIDNPLTFREFWNVTTRMTDEGVFERAKLDRGPIFNRFGGTSLDYDPLIRVPIFAMTLDEAYTYHDGEPIRTADVFSGKFLLAVRNSLTSVKKRVTDARAEAGRELDRKADALGGEMTDFIWKQAQHHTASRDNSILKEEASAAMKRAEARWAKRRSLPGYFS